MVSCMRGIGIVIFFSFRILVCRFFEKLEFLKRNEFLGVILIFERN